MPTASGHTKAVRASEVIGTSLFDSSGQNIGKVEDTILDKTSNQILFAVVSIGGVTTTSDSYYPLPWSMLDFHEGKGGYTVPCSRDTISKGPSASKVSELTREDGNRARDAAFTHYGVAAGR